MYQQIGGRRQTKLLDVDAGTLEANAGLLVMYIELSFRKHICREMSLFPRIFKGEQSAKTKRYSQLHLVPQHQLKYRTKAVYKLSGAPNWPHNCSIQQNKGRAISFPNFFSTWNLIPVNLQTLESRHMKSQGETKILELAKPTL